MEVAYICLCLDLLQFSAQLGNVLLKALAELLDVVVTLSTHLVHHVQQSVDRRSQRLQSPDQHNITCLALLYCATRLHSANCVCPSVRPFACKHADIHCVKTSKSFIKKIEISSS